jgi:hypothetical protein
VVGSKPWLLRRDSVDVRKDWNSVGAGATAKQVRAWPQKEPL